MERTTGLLALLLLGWQPAAVRANDWFGEFRLEHLNGRLCGQLIDHTNHHGADRRIWSAALCQWRNLYVYLPPGYDPSQRYPLVIWLHGFLESEQTFASRVIRPFDRAIAAGELPPAIIAAPSGKVVGQKGSLFLNTRAGAYEDFVVRDLMGFLATHYPIRPEREAHVLLGLSSGGWAAYTLSMRHPGCFGAVGGVIPYLNPRYVDGCGHYRTKFDPCCWGLRQTLDRNELLGFFYGVPITFKPLIQPFFGWGPEALVKVSQENPVEVLQRSCLPDGVLAMFVGYIGCDSEHADAQSESFLHVAECQGLHVTVDYRPNVRIHSLSTGIQFLPSVAAWLAPLLAPYSPPLTKR